MVKACYPIFKGRTSTGEAHGWALVMADLPGLAPCGLLPKSWILSSFASASSAKMRCSPPPRVLILASDLSGSGASPRSVTPTLAQEPAPATGRIYGGLGLSDRGVAKAGPEQEGVLSRGHATHGHAAVSEEVSPSPVLQGKNAHADNRASRTAPRYTIITHETNRAVTPSHLSAASSSRIVDRRIVSYKVGLRTSGRAGEGTPPDHIRS